MPIISQKKVALLLVKKLPEDFKGQISKIIEIIIGANKINSVLLV